MVNVDFKFIARSGPAILILGGILGWYLCGTTKQEVFCSNWSWVLILGVVLSLIWSGVFKKLSFGN